MKYLFGLLLSILLLFGITAKIYPFVLLVIILFLTNYKRFSSKILILIPSFVFLISLRFILCTTDECVDNQLLLIIIQIFTLLLTIFSTRKNNNSLLYFVISSSKISIILICLTVLIGNLCTFLGIGFPYDLFDTSAYRELRKLAIFFAPPISKTLLFSVPLFIFPKLESIPILLIGISLLMTKTRTELILFLTLLIFLFGSNFLNYLFKKVFFFNEDIKIDKRIFYKFKLKKIIKPFVSSSSVLIFFYLIKDKLFSEKGFLIVAYKNLFGGDVDGGSLYLRYLKIGPYCEQFMSGSFLIGLKENLSFGLEPLVLLLPCKFGLLVFIPWIMTIFIFINYINKFSNKLSVVTCIILFSTLINFYFISIATTYFLSLFILLLKNSQYKKEKKELNITSSI